jgi:hypothetical protein
LSDEAAAEMLNRVNSTESALATLADEALRTAWFDTIQRLAENETLHGLVAGRCCRILLDDHALSVEQVATRLSRHLSRGNPPAQAAAWFEGFLAGSGLVLLHQPEVWNLIDEWASGLSQDHFTEALPLLRRTFSTFSPAERRQMGELARRGTDGKSRVHTRSDEDIDETRGRRVLATLAVLLGAEPINPASTQP